VLASRIVPGRFTIPAVAYDGSAAGLSADGKTLVLIRPRRAFPRLRTVFAVVDAERLRVRRVVTLRGDFSFDALSPSGSLLYLVQYLSRRDPTRYLVRLYDLRADRLLREPVIDPREVGDVMRGLPITRAASPDGRWAYTLYDGAGGHPFVHALDTAGRTARCIDLHELAGRGDLPELRLRIGAGGTALTVVDGRGEPLAVIDTRTFRASEPAPPRAGSRESGGGSPWLLPLAGGATTLIGAAALLLARKRRAEGRLLGRPPEALEVLGGIGDEVEVELRDALLHDSPHGLAEVRHEPHEPQRPRVRLP
jgi:hypothetical protein